MVNGFSASASEIFAAAIQDYKRGIIVGSNSSTYGKGTVQRNVPLGKPIDLASGRTEYGAVKLTFQKFYRINGGSTQLKGVTPDIFMPDSYEFLKFREKDNISALPWDEIKKADYQTFSSNDYLDNTIKNTNSSLLTNTAFSIIKSNAMWLSENNSKPINLSLVKYQEQQKLIKSTVNQTNQISKLENEMNVTVATIDKSKYFSNADKAKGERYQAWLKIVKSDMYIKASAKVVTDLINASALSSARK
jgi:carboxyl-terminal processing protease